MRYLTCEQIRLAESLANDDNLANVQLIANASSAAKACITENYPAAVNYAVLVGKGNNGADGIAIAELLVKSGCNVTVICCFPADYKGLDNAKIITDIESRDAYNKIENADVIVDAVFGIGFKGELPLAITKIFDFAAKAKGVRVAIDVPSGVSGNMGEIADGCFNADLTITFTAMKTAFKHQSVIEKCGKIVVKEIGIKPQLIDKAIIPIRLSAPLIKSFLPQRSPKSHKGDFGKLLNLSGSLSMSGAAMMSTLAAMRVGAGIVRLATPAAVASMVTAELMEAMVIPLNSRRYDEIKPLLAKSTALLVGCGLGVDEDIKVLVKTLLKECKLNMVVDADALNSVSDDISALKCTPFNRIITPHIGEMSRLVGKPVASIANNMEAYAKALSAETGAIVVLKSHVTVIAAPDGNAYYNDNGNSGLSKGGSGDLLAGMIAGFTAEGINPLEAACCGVFLLGLTADRLAENMSQYSILARDILNEIPFSIKSIGR